MADLETYALITVAEFLEFRGNAASEVNLNEEHLNIHINAASKAIENHCGRIICPVTAVSAEEFWGDDTDEYFVENAKLNASPTLYYWNNTAWTEMTTTLYPREYVGDCGKVWFSNGDLFTRKVRFKISYSTGWAQASVPYPIKQACFVLVQRSLKRAEKLEGVRSVGTGDVTTSYDLHEFPDSVQRLLAPYRRVII